MCEKYRLVIYDRRGWKRTNVENILASKWRHYRGKFVIIEIYGIHYLAASLSPAVDADFSPEHTDHTTIRATLVKDLGLGEGGKHWHFPNLGGGWITIDTDSRRVELYGESRSMGKYDVQKAQIILKLNLPDFSFECI